MTYDEVLAQLESWGSPARRAIYTRQGAGENQFGVMLGDLRSLAKKLKTDHPLARQLWESGNYDAMILASMLMDSSQLTGQLAEAMVRSLNSYRLVDELSFNALAHAPISEQIRQSWMNSPDEMIGRAGWNLLVARLLEHEIAGLDVAPILAQIESEMKTAPRYKQESMNRSLVEIAVNFPELTNRCIAIGERLGRLDDRPVPKGCTSSYAPEWIAALMRRKNRSKMNK